MANSYIGSILHVDLSTDSLWVEHPAEEFYRTYGGGSAMGLYYILREMPAHSDALSPQNILTLFTGVPTGLAISGQSRLSANARSPMGGAIGDSQSGGFFPAALKFAGFDGIVVSGKAKHPVFLLIKDGNAELRDASTIWGMMTAEAEAQLRKDLDDPKLEVLQVGPAGENMVRYAAIMNMSNRANGRTGMGAVMGSKLLKAVVVQGRAKPEAADKPVIARMNREGAKAIEENPDIKSLGESGTAGVVVGQNLTGTLPSYNFSQGQFKNFLNLSGDVMSDTILKERDTCYACSIRCKRVVETEYEGQAVLPVYGGPEYETLSSLGSYCGVDDLKAVALGNQLCNQYGLDTISTGATIAFAMECYENGLLTSKDTQGIELRFGDARAMLKMVELIGKREGIGDLLAEGSAKAAEKIGKNAEEYLTTVKGTEAPAHMPQAKKTLGLIYAVNPFGADHQSHEHDPVYEEGTSALNLQRLAELGLTHPQAPGSMNEEKIRFAYLTELFYSALDSYNLCQFVWGPAWHLYGPNEMVAMLSAASGWDITLDEVLRVGERRLAMMRVFNAREGMDRKADVLPKKFSKPLTGSGPSAGVFIDNEEIEEQKDRYYAMAGWDVSSGVPGQKKLDELGLDWLKV